MSLRFVIESTPAPQVQMERVFTGGQMSIGRSDDADWQIEDPKMFVSRRHCVISEENGQVVVTDASSGGLFVDNAANPVGLGNAVPLEPGMRLHLGDFIIRVETASGTAEAPVAPQAPSMTSGFFPRDSDPVEPIETPKRPANLPDPFGIRDDERREARHKEVSRTPRPLDQMDPFGLDLRKGNADDPRPETPPAERGSFGKFFNDGPEGSEPEPEMEPVAPPKKPDIFGDWSAPKPAVEPAPETPLEQTPVDPEFSMRQAEHAAAEDARTSASIDQAPAPVRSRTDEDLRDALLRGMGLDPAHIHSEDPIAEMEHLGRCMHGLVEGLMLLLRTRAQEKQKVRVAQTIIASTDVNPLKFLATPEDALSALIKPRGKGYMAPDAAVEGAFRDLIDHQVRTWSALQVALRQMVDKFDPGEIEKEMEDVGLLESLVAGGRSAKLWQIYEDRYRDIAETAEKQFLGEVGIDFRDAYENRRSD